MKDEEDKRIQFSLSKKFIEELSHEFDYFEQIETMSALLVYTIAKNFQVDIQEKVLEILFLDMKETLKKTRDVFKKGNEDVD